MRAASLCLATLGLVCLVTCARGPLSEETLRLFPVSDLEGVLTRSGVAFDTETTSDGNGSIRLEAKEPTTFRIYEVDDLDVEDALLTYRAKLRTDDFRGRVYLEMWCRFPGMGEYFSRALQTPVSGTTEWTWQETPFFLEGGQNPDLVKLNLVLEGSGTAWLDEVVLAKAMR